jgi:hypothetical protein
VRASVISGEMEDIGVYVNDGDSTVSSLLLLLVLFDEDNREVELLSDLVIMVAA